MNKDTQTPNSRIRWFITPAAAPWKTLPRWWLEQAGGPPLLGMYLQIAEQWSR